MKELFEYQKEDVEKLSKVKCSLIGSEMGTGKTIEALELIRPRLDGRKHLIVAPLSTFQTWEKEIESQLGCPYYIIEPKNRNLFVKAAAFAKQGIFVCHYQALRLMPELAGIEFDTIIADECHRVANRKSKQTIAFKELKSEYKIAMSGTASGDKAWNLWSILNWLYPKEFSSYWAFITKYVEQGYGAQGYREFLGIKNEDQLLKKINHFYVRHMKREKCCNHHPKGVASFLPEKVYTKTFVEMSPTQKKYYKQMSEEMVAWIETVDEKSPLVASIVISKLLRLSQMALATPSFDENGGVILSAPSSKIDILKEFIEDNPNEKIVVYTTYKQMVYLVHQELKKAKINSLMFTGDLSTTERGRVVNTFNKSDEVNVLIATIQSVGTGIDGLQNRCSTAIFLNRSLIAAENQQAEDRLHRIGQKDSVNIIDIMASESIEIEWAALINAKWHNIKKILGDFRK